MYDLYNNLTYETAILPQTLSSTGSPTQLTSGAIDLQGFEACDIVAIFGDIDEMGSSPVGSATAELALDHSDDGTTWTVVVLADVVGPTSVDSNGGCVTATTDASPIKCGYRGGKRYVRARLIAASLTNGGNACVVAVKGNAHHKAQ